MLDNHAISNATKSGSKKKIMVLLRNVFGQIFSKFGLLVVFVLVGICAPIVFQLIAFAKDFDPQNVLVEAGKKTKEMAPIKGATAAQTNQRLTDLRATKAKKTAERGALTDESCFLPTCKFLNSGKIYRIDVELDLIGQAIAYGEAARDGPELCKKWTNRSERLKLLVSLDQQLNNGKPPGAPTAPSHQAIKDEIADLERSNPFFVNGCSAYKKLPDEFVGKLIQGNETVHAEFLNKVQDLKRAKAAVWNAILEVLPSALLALVGIIAIPWAVSAASFYGIAPLATRRFGVQLAPDSSGELSMELGSEKKLKISLRPGWEVLTDPGLVSGWPKSANRKLRLLFDRSMPLSSLVCGLYLMTNIRSEQDAEITLSARQSKAPPSGVVIPESSQLALLDLPENAALVLQPRCLVGIVQQIDQPIRITKHWRVGNLSSWLTMQLRYIVFHGPGKLIVRGNGGVKVGKANEEFSINQAATLGFSANLRYGVSRCENFYVYISGKRELFDDSFSMGPGYYVQEVSPVLVDGGPIRRPWEVWINAILKAFGLG